MDLTDEDKKRIEQEAAKLFNRWDGGLVNVQTMLLSIAEYATLYERQQLDKFIVYKDLKTGEMMARYEAERAELRNKVIEECIESLKAKGVEESDYNGKIILSTLNSLKTK